MATEAIPDARHEAMVALHRAILEAEAGDRHEAETAIHTALAWVREMPSSRPIKPVTS
jgi:DNA-binding FadR family transcriptional regulator